MLYGEELKQALEYLPVIEVKDTVESRLEGLLKLQSIYIPSRMSMEIYHKIYLATKEKERKGILGGSDSFSIIGKSGIGKSSAIARASELIVKEKVVEEENPYTKRIPILQIQTPFDSSPKGLLLEILRKTDELLKTTYYQKAMRRNVTTDILIGMVSKVCKNHIGLLILDEIQHLRGSKNGKLLMQLLIQLINSSSISICFCGTPESMELFRETEQLARRTVGLAYLETPLDDYFRECCEVLFAYQFTEEENELTEGMIEWLYNHSGGLISTLKNLYYTANEMAILEGEPRLTLGLFERSFEQLKMLHPYLSNKKTTHPRRKATPSSPTLSPSPTSPTSTLPNNQEIESLESIIIKAKDKGENIVEAVRKQVTVEEIKL